MIKIYGHSDDVVVIDGDITDELGAFDRERVITIGGEGEGLQITVEYSNTGTWQFALRQLDEDVPMPWPIRVVPEHAYSLAVIVDCPPETPVDFDEDEAEDEQ